MTHARASHQRRQQAKQKRRQHAKPRRLERARAHLQPEQAQAQRHLPALEQALGDGGLPETLAAGEHLWTDVADVVWVSNRC
jgi:hypothetical protein